MNKFQNRLAAAEGANDRPARAPLDRQVDAVAVDRLLAHDDEPTFAERTFSLGSKRGTNDENGHGADVTIRTVHWRPSVVPRRESCDSRFSAYKKTAAPMDEAAQSSVEISAQFAEQLFSRIAISF